MELTPIEKMMSTAKVQLILQKAQQEKKNMICQWCFEEPALEGKSVCQACIDAANRKEDDDFDLDKWLEEDEIMSEQKEGKIIETIKNGASHREFSCCGTDFTILTMWMIPKYCPNCGTKMDTKIVQAWKEVL